jgi:hypothetical protein
MDDFLNWIENEAARGLSEGDTVAALTAIKWKIKDNPPHAKTIGTEPQSSADSAELEARLALADELMLPGGTHPYLGARKRAMIVAALRARAEPRASAGSGEEWNPTDEQVRSAAMWYRHDLGLLTVAEAAKVKTEARLWLRSWQKEVAALRAEPQTARSEREAKRFERTGLHVEEAQTLDELDPGAAFIIHNVDDTVTIQVRSPGDRAFSEVEMPLDAWTKLRCVGVPAHSQAGSVGPLQCLRCGTVDAFGPVSAEKK